MLSWSATFPRVRCPLSPPASFPASPSPLRAAGAATAITGVYFFIAAQGQLDEGLGLTLAIMWTGAAAMAGTGALAYSASRTRSLRRTPALLLTSLGAEAAAAWLLDYVHSSYAFTAYAAVGGSQLFPLLLAAFAVGVLRCVKHRMNRMLSTINSDNALAVVAYPTEREVRAIVRVQAFVRAYLVRGHVQRRRELEAWAGRQISCQRRVMLSLAYLSLAAMTGVLMFIVLLYGVEFERAQTRAWIVATLLSFVSDALVTEPAKELLKVVAELLLMLWERSVKGAVAHALVTKRDAARLRLKVALANKMVAESEATTARSGTGAGAAAGRYSVGAPKAALVQQADAVPLLPRFGIADLLSE